MAYRKSTLRTVDTGFLPPLTNVQGGLRGCGWLTPPWLPGYRDYGSSPVHSLYPISACSLVTQAALSDVATISE